MMHLCHYSSEEKKTAKIKNLDIGWNRGKEGQRLMSIFYYSVKGCIIHLSQFNTIDLLGATYSHINADTSDFTKTWRLSTCSQVNADLAATNSSYKVQTGDKKKSWHKKKRKHLVSFLWRHKSSKNKKKVTCSWTKITPSINIALISR